MRGSKEKCSIAIKTQSMSFPNITAIQPERIIAMKTRVLDLSAKSRKTSMHRNLRVFAVDEDTKLNIYLGYPDGSKYYLMTHRWNHLLWSLLKDDGRYVDELRRLQPKGSRRRQNSYESVRHLLKVIDSFCQHDMAA